VVTKRTIYFNMQISAVCPRIILDAIL